jgi:hypothetical protein
MESFTISKLNGFSRKMTIKTLFGDGRSDLQEYVTFTFYLNKPCVQCEPEDEHHPTHRFCEEIISELSSGSPSMKERKMRVFVNEDDCNTWIDFKTKYNETTMMLEITQTTAISGSGDETQDNYHFTLEATPEVIKQLRKIDS